MFAVLRQNVYNKKEAPFGGLPINKGKANLLSCNYDYYCSCNNYKYEPN